MKKIFCTCAFLVSASIIIAQTYRINWGNEIKLKKGTTDLDIVSADNTGLYFTESKLAMKSYFLIATTYGTAQTLLKFDKNYNEIFEKDYKKELKGLDYNSFQPLDNDIYLFASDYLRKEKLFKVYGSKLDKNNGALLGDFTELGSFALESRRDDYQMKMTPIHDGKNFLMVANISGKDRVSLGISVLDKNLKMKENAVIDLAFNEDEFSLQDVQYTASGKIILLGKQYEETQVGKKKKKRFVFKQYVMMVYDNKGKKEKDIALNAGERFVISGQLIQQAEGSLLLAGFYSNTAKKEELSGFFINKLDPQTGTLTLTSFKEINANMLGKGVEDDADEDDDNKSSKNKKNNDDDAEDELPNEYVIRSVNINPVDQSIIITSEMSSMKHYSYTTYSYSSTTGNSTNSTEVYLFENKDILVINADKEGNIKWLNDIPKSQRESVRYGRTSPGTGSSFNSTYLSYFGKGGGMPYYSSFVSLVTNTNLFIILNDHTSNNINAQYGDKVKVAYNFKKRSNVYGVSIDLATGKMTRKVIAANDSETILMPRHGYALKNEVIIPSWRMHALGKTELKFAKIAIK